MVLAFKPAVIIYWLLIVLAVSVAVFFLVTNTGFEDSLDAMAEKGPVLVIDAGHGGTDGGAVSVTGEYESNINLAIALKMQAIAGLTGTQCVMTRESADIDYPDEANTLRKKKAFDQQSRVKLIEGIVEAVLISIHQNKYPTGQPSGPHAFYGPVEGSDDLARLVQANLDTMICPGNRRVIAPVSDSLYIYKNISCVAVLAECGFLSNREEARLLEEDSHQLKIALALMNAYFTYADSAAS